MRPPLWLDEVRWLAEPPHQGEQAQVQEDGDREAEAEPAGVCR